MNTNIEGLTMRCNFYSLNFQQIVERPDLKKYQMDVDIRNSDGIKNKHLMLIFIF